MKTNIKIVLMSWFLFSFASINAQEETPAKPQPQGGIILHMGPSANYFQGQQSGSYEEFESKRINFQLNAFLGYQSPRGNGGNSIGIFGTTGYTNAFTLDEILSIQNINVINLKSSSYNTFYQVEAGMIISNVLRLSTGVGSQNYSTTIADEKMDYFSTTAGLLINFGNVIWSLDANYNYGWDYSHTTVKFSTGLILVL